MHERTIETTYKGTKYRSRTEARWAVLFDYCGVGFQYEPEGFNLSSGRYVPDFWLDMGCYFEVKPEECEAGPGHYTRERLVAEDLASLKGKTVVMACGSPNEAMDFLWFEPNAISPDYKPITDYFTSWQIKQAKAYRFDWEAKPFQHVGNVAWDVLKNVREKMKNKDGE